MKNLMPKVVDCDARECAFNKNDRCHALAVNIGGLQPDCDTFLTSGKKGGILNVTAGVGACKVEVCKYNMAYACTAPSIHVKILNNRPDCITYQAPSRSDCACATICA